MILSNGELKKYTRGAVYFEEKDGIIPYRFTEKQLSIPYDPINEIRHRTTTGVRIDFYSDTQEVSFNYKILTPCVNSIYNLYYFDIYVDNTLVLHQGEKNADACTQGKINLSIKKGNKRITIYLPGSCSVEISDFSISSGSDIQQIEYDKKAIFFGDSITHAAYLDFPSMSYVNILTRKMNYDFVNQAIGGDIFDKNNLAFLPEYNADSIFVAYGTNDWQCSNENTPEQIDEYFNLLKKSYPNSKINVILPTWRGDINDHPQLKYSFFEIREMIEKTALKCDMTVFDGLNFVPNHKFLLRPDQLHPTESGFMFYADELEKRIKNNA